MNGGALLLVIFLNIILIVQRGCTESVSDIGYIWHVTDFHYDPTYSVTSLSCDNSTDLDFGTYGNIRCDAPWALVKSSVHAMKSIEPDVDFILWTGDTLLHQDPDDIDHKVDVAILSNVTNLLKTTFPQTPVYAAFGNHDADHADQFEPRNTLLYNEGWARWRHWIKDGSQETSFRKGGFYTVKVSPFLRVIVLNTVLYYKPNRKVSSDGDPAGQFRWLIDTLQVARKDHEKVIITAHISPGVQPNGETELFKDQNERLIDILNQYSDIISVMHFGHEHLDAFKVLTNKEGVPTVPIFLAPSVTAMGVALSHNPGVRLIKYHRKTGLPIEILQYYLDIKAANIARKASWELEYSFTHAYGLADLTSGSLYELINKLKNADSREFKSYWKHYVVSPPGDIFAKCDDRCHARVLCGLSEFTESEFAKCFQEQGVNSFSFWKWFFR